MDISNWPSARFKVGQEIKFLDLSVVRTATVIGHDTQDRLLCRYEIHSGIFYEEASIHISLIKE